MKDMVSVSKVKEAIDKYMDARYGDYWRYSHNAKDEVVRAIRNEVIDFLAEEPVEEPKGISGTDFEKWSEKRDNAVEEPKPEGAIEEALDNYIGAIEEAEKRNEPTAYIDRKVEQKARAELAALIEERRALKERLSEAEEVIRETVCVEEEALKAKVGMTLQIFVSNLDKMRAWLEARRSEG